MIAKIEDLMGKSINGTAIKTVKAMVSFNQLSFEFKFNRTLQMTQATYKRHE